MGTPPFIAFQFQAGMELAMGLGFDQGDGDEQQPDIDYTTPIARKGEQQFACILRQRSGVSAGEIDFGLRDCTILGEAEQQDVCDVAFALYQSICRQTGKQAESDAR